MEHKFQLDLTDMPKELKVLLELIKDNNDQNIHQHKNEWFANLNWDYFLKLAMHHRIYPQVYLKIKEVVSELIPVSVLQTLKAEYEKNTFRMLYLSKEMERISKLFTENQIRSLFLKGPVVAHDLYGDISLRTSKDLDILIPEFQLSKAESLLLKEGYEKEEVSTLLNEIKWRQYHIVYFHPEKKIQIEIHWRLNPRPIKEPEFENLWGRRRMSSLTTHPVSFLGKEDLFLYLTAHGARHGWFRLRWLKDIDQMCRCEMDYKKVDFFIKEYQHQRVVGQALVLNSELFSSSLNPILESVPKNNISTKLAQSAIYYIRDITHIYGVGSEEVLKYHRRYLFSLKSIRQKIFFMIISFYPSSSDKAVLALPKKLHFLYFPLRPLLWTSRKFKSFKPLKK
ncbi:nucleotidyltransferase family protein [Priestia megaterium]|uniref:nucleotidyltransferase domain-containing protein n=1 Tax=Priestia megaterium TaxID=1404 RepID=UPI00301BB9A3